MEKLLGGLLLCLFSTSVCCQSATDVKDLKTALFTTGNYDATIRPITDRTMPTFVYVEFHLLAINAVDEVTETLKTTGFLRLYWQDEYLIWDSTSYNGVEWFFHPQNDVWKPDVALKNSYLKYEQLGDKSLLVNVYQDGSMEWAPFQVFQSTCSIDITKFPYDSQTCSLKFVAWSYTKLEVEMEGGTEGMVLEDYQRNSAWDLVATRWYTVDENNEAAIVFELTMDRKPLHSLLTLVFPVIMLAVLNLFVFALPSDGGEKAGYAVTVFLAFAVFLTIMESSFPENSETVSYFAIYVVIETVQSTLITIIALLMIRLAAMDDQTKVPRFLVIVARFSKCAALRGKLNKKRVEPHKTSQICNIESLDGIDTKIPSKEPETILDDTKEQEVECTWKYVANALDVFFFTFFLLSFLIATLVCVLLAKHS